MANLSQEKRQRMLAFLNTIREEHKDDDDVLIALGEIENELNSKKYVYKSIICYFYNTMQLLKQSRS